MSQLEPAPAPASSSRWNELSNGLFPLPDLPADLFEDSVVETPRRDPEVSILQTIERGGMGVVQKGVDRRLRRSVAIKRPLNVGPAGLICFRREAEALAKLKHPNIVRIYRIGEDEAGPYLEMEFCEEGTLKRLLGANPLSIDAAVELLRVLALAVGYLHREGVVHRDLKPANILFDSLKTPKIADFGLARLEDESRTTRTGDVFGTPAYMSPEQAAGASEVGPSSDIHSLGAILFECLIGRPPFEGKTALETMTRVREEEPPPLRTIRREVPTDLDAICRKCLAKHPAARYGSAEEFAEDLRRYQAGEPILAAPPSLLGRLLRVTIRGTKRLGKFLVSRPPLRWLMPVIRPIVRGVRWTRQNAIPLAFTGLILLLLAAGGIAFGPGMYYRARAFVFPRPTPEWQEVGPAVPIYERFGHGFHPAGWMPDGDLPLQIIEDYRENPGDGEVCCKIICDPTRASKGWLAVAWLLDGTWTPLGKQDWFKSLGIHRGEPVVLRFKARSPNSAVVAFESCSAGTGWVTLSETWKDYQIDLTGEDLSGITNAFAWKVDRFRNNRPISFYLDRIRVVKVAPPKP